MARWKAAALAEIHRLTLEGRVVLTDKARREIDRLGPNHIDEDDISDVLLGLNVSDLVQRVHSTVTPEWLYVFKPEVSALMLYIKIAIRENCVVISFHENE